MKEWQKEHEETAYKGFRTINKKTFRLPDGSVKVFDVKMERDVACIFALTPEEKVVLIRQFRPGPERILTEMPGGEVEPGETWDAAVARELKEETGYVPESLIYLGTSLSCPYTTRIKHNYLALGCRPEAGAALDPEEQTEPFEMPLPEFRERLLAGEFPESDTAFLALARYDKASL